MPFDILLRKKCKYSDRCFHDEHSFVQPFYVINKYRYLAPCERKCRISFPLYKYHQVQKETGLALSNLHHVFFLLFSFFFSFLFFSFYFSPSFFEDTNSIVARDKDEHIDISVTVLYRCTSRYTSRFHFNEELENHLEKIWIKSWKSCYRLSVFTL